MLSLPWSTYRVLGKIGEWLVVIDEARIGMPRGRIGEAARIPCPRYTCVGEAAANRPHSLRRQPQPLIHDPWIVQCRSRFDRVHGIDIRCDRGVSSHVTLFVELDHQVARSSVIAWRAGTDEPGAVKEPATKSRVKEMVQQRVLFGQLVQWQRPAIDVTHRETTSIRNSYKLVHSATVNLLLLLIEAVHQIASHLLEADIAVNAERTIWKTEGKARMDPLLAYIGVDDRRQPDKFLSFLVHLIHRVTRMVNPIGAGEESVKVIKTPVLKDYHYNVADPVQGPLSIDGHLCKR